MTQSRSSSFLVVLSTLAIGLVSLIFPSSVGAYSCYTYPFHPCTYYSTNGHQQGFCTTSPGGVCACQFGLSHQQSQMGCVKSF
jgi:hypothetical protein